MHKIYVLWCHPRSMSTAVERIMRERGDLACFHEPFTYDYYAHRRVRVMPHFQPQKDHPVSFEAVRDMLLNAAQRGPVFIKEMSYYVIPRILTDADLSQHLVNSFLIRAPQAALASYFRLDPDFTCQEAGLEAQAVHFRGLQSKGMEPPILQAEDIRCNATSFVKAWWAAIGLPPADHAFDWQEEPPSDWQQVSGWHRDVSSSKGIRPISAAEIKAQEAAFETLAQQHPHLRDILRHHLPHYKQLRAHAMTPD